MHADPDTPPTPDPEGDPELTAALRRMGGGGEGPRGEELATVVAELRRVARGYLAGHGAAATLQATALVNEAFLKLLGSKALGSVVDRQHFFALAARAMRQALVDHARRRTAGRRGGGAAAGTLAEGALAEQADDADVLDVDEALEELARLDERQARVVELRFFGGLEVEEVAAAMELSASTVEREWRAARAWLGRRMTDRRGT